MRERERECVCESERESVCGGGEGSERVHHVLEEEGHLPSNVVIEWIFDFKRIFESPGSVQWIGTALGNTTTCVQKKGTCRQTWSL